MTISLKNLLSLILLSGFTLATVAQAQPTSLPSSDTVPNAEKADQMRKESLSARNPTLKNKTFQNQAKEQPPTHPQQSATVQTNDGKKDTTRRKHHASRHH